jgi:hypothetical protein
MKREHFDRKIIDLHLESIYTMLVLDHLIRLRRVPVDHRPDRMKDALFDERTHLKDLCFEGLEFFDKLLHRPRLWFSSQRWRQQDGREP